MHKDVLFGSNADGDDFVNSFFCFKICSFLHGDFAERVDIHTSVGKVDSVVLYFDLLYLILTFWEE